MYRQCIVYSVQCTVNKVCERERTSTTVQGAGKQDKCSVEEMVSIFSGGWSVACSLLVTTSSRKNKQKTTGKCSCLLEFSQ